MKRILAQPGILADCPPVGRSLTFRLLPKDPSLVRKTVQNIQQSFNLDWGVIAFGEPLILSLGKPIKGLRTFPSFSGAACEIPSTQQGIWAFLRAADRGILFDLTDKLKSLLDETFVLESAMDTFTYSGGRDLTGYVDGTENPKDQKAVETAIVNSNDDLNGSSYVAVQRWVHDLSVFRNFSARRQDQTIGRSKKTNIELSDAPASAHVKRTAQESFEPPAFMFRRSMPWATQSEQGLEFIAYGRSLDPFETVLKKMAGLDDGVVDALFSFSRPVTGGYYWCPPVREGKINLKAMESLK